MPPWERDEMRSRSRGMYRDGEARSAIARAVNVSERQVYRWTSDLPRRLGRRATDAEILKLLRAGVPHRQIVRRLRTQHARVKRLCLAAGLPMRKPGRQRDRGWKSAAGQ